MSSTYDNDRRVRLQLGSLEPLLQAAADAKGHSIQVEIRERLAASLGVPAPSLDEFRDLKPKTGAKQDRPAPGGKQAINRHLEPTKYQDSERGKHSK